MAPQQQETGGDSSAVLFSLFRAMLNVAHISLILFMNYFGFVSFDCKGVIEGGAAFYVV